MRWFYDYDSNQRFITEPSLEKLSGIKKADSFLNRLLEFGAGKETRTPDPNLGKVVLYQLSYSRLSAAHCKYRSW